MSKIEKLDTVAVHMENDWFWQRSHQIMPTTDKIVDKINELVESHNAREDENTLKWREIDKNGMSFDDFKVYHDWEVVKEYAKKYKPSKVEQEPVQETDWIDKALKEFADWCWWTVNNDRTRKAKEILLKHMPAQPKQETLKPLKIAELCVEYLETVQKEKSFEELDSVINSIEILQKVLVKYWTPPPMKEVDVKRLIATMIAEMKKTSWYDVYYHTVSLAPHNMENILPRLENILATHYIPSKKFTLAELEKRYDNMLYKLRPSYKKKEVDKLMLWTVWIFLKEHNLYQD